MKYTGSERLMPGRPKGNPAVPVFSCDLPYCSKRHTAENTNENRGSNAGRDIEDAVPYGLYPMGKPNRTNRRGADPYGLCSI